MKHLKKFNEHRLEEQSDLGEDIANDLLPIFQEMRDSGEIITVDIFDKYMEERGASSDIYHSVMNHLVNMGFDFDIEKDEEGDFDEPFINSRFNRNI